MLANNVVVTLAVGMVSVGLAACRDTARAKKPEERAGRQTASAALPSSPKQNRRIPRRDAGHEAFLSSYNNPDEGVAFQYPRNYTLEEGEIQEHSYFLITQEGLDREQPGAVLVATVLIPADGYPNTTFEHGSLQVVTGEAEASESCLAEISEGADRKRGKLLSAGGVSFDWIEESSTTGGVSVRERRYASFSGGTCYEFFAVVAVDETPDQDSFKKPADVAKILHQLEKIIASVELQQRRTDESDDTGKEEPIPMQISRAM